MWVLPRVSWGAEFAVLIGLRWFVTFVLIVVLFMFVAYLFCCVGWFDRLCSGWFCGGFLLSVCLL